MAVDTRDDTDENRGDIVFRLTDQKAKTRKSSVLKIEQTQDLRQQLLQESEDEDEEEQYQEPRNAEFKLVQLNPRFNDMATEIDQILQQKQQLLNESLHLFSATVAEPWEGDGIEALVAKQRRVKDLTEDLEKEINNAFDYLCKNWHHHVLHFDKALTQAQDENYRKFNKYSKWLKTQTKAQLTRSRRANRVEMKAFTTLEKAQLQDHLRRQAAELEKDRQELQEQHDRQLRAKLLQLDSVRKEKDQLGEQNVKLVDENRKLVRQYKKFQREVKHARHHVHRAEWEALQKQSKESQEELKELTLSNNQLRVEYEAQNEKMKKMTAEENAQAKEIRELRQMLLDSHEALLSSKSKKEDMQEKIRELQHQITLNTGSIQHLEAQILDLRELDKKSIARIDSLSKSLIATQDTKKQLQQMLDETNAHLLQVLYTKKNGAQENPQMGKNSLLYVASVEDEYREAIRERLEQKMTEEFEQNIEERVRTEMEQALMGAFTRKLSSRLSYERACITRYLKTCAVGTITKQQVAKELIDAFDSLKVPSWDGEDILALQQDLAKAKDEIEKFKAAEKNLTQQIQQQNTQIMTMELGMKEKDMLLDELAEKCRKQKLDVRALQQQVDQSVISARVQEQNMESNEQFLSVSKLTHGQDNREGTRPSLRTVCRVTNTLRSRQKAVQSRNSQSRPYSASALPNAVDRQKSADTSPGKNNKNRPRSSNVIIKRRSRKLSPRVITETSASPRSAEREHIRSKLKSQFFSESMKFETKTATPEVVTKVEGKTPDIQMPRIKFGSRGIREILSRRSSNLS